jgi:sugar O-acyltransferase (sialic acid O-acetyltransferase NeuD family)
MSKEEIQPGGILIIGTSTLAIWVADLIESEGGLVYGFAPPKAQEEKESEGLPILPPITQARMWKLIARREADYVIALVEPEQRERMATQLFERVQWPARTVVHPSVYKARTAEVAGGAILFPSVVLGPQVKVGGYVVIEANSSIGPGTEIADFVNIGSGCQIGESCRIESYAIIGRGAILTPGVRIGKGAQVLAGSVVLDHVAPGQTVGGNPAQVL